MGALPEILEEMIELAMSRRARSVKLLGEENCSGFPLIDQTKENKLHLYGLLRNSADLDHINREYTGGRPKKGIDDAELVKELAAEGKNLQVRSGERGIRSEATKRCEYHGVCKGIACDTALTTP